MKTAAPLLLLRLALFVAIFACAVLVVDYENVGDPAFCGFGSGCLAVRRSTFSHVAGVPLPILGLCANAGLLSLVLLTREKGHTLFVMCAAWVGALVAGALLLIQAVRIHAFCKWCVIVDSSAIVAALAATVVHLQANKSARFETWLAALAARRVNAIVWATGAAAAAALPFLWGEYPVIPALPTEIAALAVPGKVTIVSFTDFECPFCRKLDPVLKGIETNWGDRVAMVRKMVPLPGHPGALPAARAYTCTPSAKREAMARLLYRAPDKLLTRDGTIAMAETLAIEGAEFGRCLDAPSTKAALETDLALFEVLGARAIPLTYIGPRVLAGFSVERAQRDAQLAMEGERPALPLAWMLVAVGFIGVALIVLSARFALRLPPVEASKAV